MEKLDQYRWQKASDIRADTVRAELLDRNNKIILEFSLDQSGATQVLFCDDCIGKIICIELLKKVMAEAEEQLRMWND